MIKFLDLRAENEPLLPEFLKDFRQILNDSDFVNGHAVSEFEREFFEFLGGGTGGCVGVGNGTDALEISLRALNLPKNSQILMCATTFKASAEAVLNTRLRPVIVDCDENFNFDPSAVLGALNENTSAIIATHLYGQIAAISALKEICTQNNLALIEDVSQAHGARTKIGNETVAAGLIGDVGTFSFYPSKNLGALGDGGAIVSTNENLIARARSIANHGALPKNTKIKPQIGRNSRLDSLQAAFLRKKLEILNEKNLARQKQAALYTELLLANKNLKIPKIPLFQASHVWHIYAVKLQRDFEGARDSLREFLAFCGVQTHVHYPQHLGAIKEFSSSANCTIHPVPNANSWQKNVLSLPIGAHMDDEKIRFVCEKINAFSVG